MKAFVRFSLPAVLAASSVVAPAASADPRIPWAEAGIHTIDLCPLEEGGRRCDAKMLADDAGVPIESMGGPVGGYTPADLQSAYGIPPAGGNGRLVAVFGGGSDYPNAESDLAVYRAQFGLPPCTSQTGCFQRADEHGGTNYPPPGTNKGEQALDIEMVSAGCPGCRILLIEGNDLDVVLPTALAAGASAFSFSIASTSGSSAKNAANCQAYGYDDTSGLLVTSAIGDSSYPGNSSWLPTACRGVVAVGGTKLLKDTSARGWSEIAWGGTGSGCDTSVSKPAWQTDPSCAGRMTADISATASPYPGVAFYFTTGGKGWGSVGGTSVAAPLIAGAFTNLGIADGHFTPAWIWQNGANLYDVTSGTNDTHGVCADAGLPTYFCNAEPGYDGPTGWGSPNGALLAKASPPGGPASEGDASVEAGSEPDASAPDATIDPSAPDAMAEPPDAGEGDASPPLGAPPDEGGGGAVGGCAATPGASASGGSVSILVALLVGAVFARRHRSRAPRHGVTAA